MTGNVSRGKWGVQPCNEAALRPITQTMVQLRSFRRFVATGVVIGAVAAGCTQAEHPGQPDAVAAPEEPAVLPAAAPERPPGALRVAVPGLPENWDPALAATPAAAQQVQHVMEPLIRYEADGRTFRSGLAESWAYDPEELTFTVTLHGEARFSTGVPVTSADVAFSIADWRAGPVFGDRYAMIRDTTIIDDRTIVFELTEPAPDLELALSQAAAGVLPANYGGRTRSDYLNEPIGAGPYRIRDWAPSSQVVLVPNPVYHRPDDVTFDTVTVTATPDDATRLAAFRGGSADVVTIRSWDIPELPIDQVVRADPHRLTFVGLNRNRPVGDTAVTDALSATLDYPTMADQAEHTMTIPYGADGLVPPDIDPDAAAALGQAELIFDANDREHQRLAESIQAGVASMGHYLQLTGVDADAFDRRRAEGDYDLILVRTGAFETATDLADDAELTPLVAHRAVFARNPAIDGFTPRATGTWWFDELSHSDQADAEAAEG